MSTYLPLKIEDMHTIFLYQLIYKKILIYRTFAPLSVSRTSDKHVMPVPITSPFTPHPSVEFVKAETTIILNKNSFTQPLCRKTIHSDDFVLDKNLCERPCFNLDNNVGEGFIGNKYNATTDENNILSFPLQATMYVKVNEKQCTTCLIPQVPER